jgi:hypothetical protein
VNIMKPNPQSNPAMKHNDPHCGKTAKRINPFGMIASAFAYRFPGR